MNENIQSQLNTYINYLTSRTVNFEDIKEIKKLLQSAEGDSNLKQLIDEIKKEPDIDKKYILVGKKTETKETDTKDLISKVYGINISNIEHKKLNNDNEIFMFFNSDLQKNVVLKNEVKGKTLIQQLKEMQDENQKYQTENYINNSEQILADKSMKEDTELKMIPINQLYNYSAQLSNLNKEELVSLDNLIKNKDKFHIEYINIENVFGITSADYGNKIYESYYDKSTNQVKIAEPDTVSYKTNDFTNDDQLKNTNYQENTNNEIQTSDLYKDINIIESDYQEIPTILAGQIKDTENINDVSKRVSEYIKYPELLNSIEENERKMYIEYIRIVMKKINEKTINKSYQKVLQMPNNISNKKAGYIDALILALLTGFASGVVATLIIMIIK